MPKNGKFCFPPTTRQLKIKHSLNNYQTAAMASYRQVKFILYFVPSTLIYHNILYLKIIFYQPQQVTGKLNYAHIGIYFM